MLTEDIINNILRNVAEIVPKHLSEGIVKTQKLRIKIGFDPTAPNLHLGHLVLLKKLREFQNFDVFVYCIIGNFTGQIGDPTGKKKTRKALHKKFIDKNCREYEKQILTILDKKKTMFLYNASWLNRLRCENVLSLLNQQTAARIFERKDFKLRLKTGCPLTLCELSYPIFQGYDSVVIAADMELGGTDQKFNLLMGRLLQKKNTQKQQYALLLPIIPGTDGTKKMSKTTKNNIDICINPTQLYSKIMSIRDSCINEYYKAFGYTHTYELPFELKKKLAEHIVSLLHGTARGIIEKNKFTRLTTEKILPENIPQIVIDNKTQFSLVELFKKHSVTKSNKETKRLLAQRCIKLNGITTTADVNKTPCNNFLIQIGKHRYLSVTK